MIQATSAGYQSLLGMKELVVWQKNSSLGRGFEYFLFLPLFGEDSHFD